MEMFGVSNELIFDLEHAVTDLLSEIETKDSPSWCVLPNGIIAAKPSSILGRSIRNLYSRTKSQNGFGARVLDLSITCPAQFSLCGKLILEAPKYFFTDSSLAFSKVWPLALLAVRCSPGRDLDRLL